MNFLKSADKVPNIPGVPLPWTENQNSSVVRKRAAGCAIMDKLHERFNYYGDGYYGGFQWGSESWHKV